MSGVDPTAPTAVGTSDDHARPSGAPPLPPELRPRALPPPRLATNEADLRRALAELAQMAERERLVHALHALEMSARGVRVTLERGTAVAPQQLRCVAELASRVSEAAATVAAGPPADRVEAAMRALRGEGGAA